MDITVALCTYNPKRAVLMRAVESVLRQLQEVAAEFILIDNNSTPSIEEMGILKDLPVRIVREPKQGLTAAREAAIAQARGDTILFVDDDNILAPGYLRGVADAFERPDIGLLGGRIVPEYETPPEKWFFPFEESLAVRRHPVDCMVETAAPPYSIYFPVGAGFAVRSSLARDYVRETEEKGRIEGRKGNSLSSGEDLDLCLHVLHRGFKLQVRGALQLTHVIPAGRTREDYISRLAVSSLNSCAQIENKWSAVFRGPVFPMFQIKGRALLLRLAVFAMLRPLSPAYRVKYKFFAALAKLRRSGALAPAGAGSEALSSGIPVSKGNMK